MFRRKSTIATNNLLRVASTTETPNTLLHLSSAYQLGTRTLTSRNGNDDQYPRSVFGNLFSGVSTFFVERRERIIAARLKDRAELTYHGPSYRYVTFPDLAQLKQYIRTSMTNNCRSGEQPIHHLPQYILYGRPSPWFGGTGSLQDLRQGYLKRMKELPGYVIFIKPVPKNDPREKISANRAYYFTMGESNPKGYEHEILHLNGNYGDLSPHCIRGVDLDRAIAGEKVTCVLTENKIRPLDWDEAERRFLLEKENSLRIG
jgi:hypothetical protein